MKTIILMNAYHMVTVITVNSGKMPMIYPCEKSDILRVKAWTS